MNNVRHCTTMKISECKKKLHQLSIDFIKSRKKGKPDESVRLHTEGYKERYTNPPISSNLTQSDRQKIYSWKKRSESVRHRHASLTPYKC